MRIAIWVHPIKRGERRSINRIFLIYLYLYSSRSKEQLTTRALEPAENEPECEEGVGVEEGNEKEEAEEEDDAVEEEELSPQT